MTYRIGGRMIALILVVLAGVVVSAHAHQDPCHRLHSCPSDHHTYVCGDTRRCDQCPDNQFCLAGTPRAAASPAPAPVQPAPTSPQPSPSCGPTVCFTPGGHCTDLIVHTMTGAKSSMLVQAYSFTSVRHAAH
jgi:hypothetical protein